MSSQRVLIHLRFTDTEHWKNHQGLIRLLTERKDTEQMQMQYLSDFWEFIHAVREKGY